MAFNSTFGAFTSARLGIYASQKGLQVTGNNIANINTVGYTRQRLDQRSLKVGAHDRYQTKFDVNVGNGALCTGVSQIRDPYLDIRYRAEMASVGAMESKLSVLNDLASILDEVSKNDNDGVIQKQLTELETALRSFTKPGTGHEEYDSLVRSAASELVTSFNYYAKKLEEVRVNADNKFHQDLTEVNEILSNIRDLNEDIRLSDIHGDKALEQRDERNLLIDKLSEFMKIDVTYTTESIGGGQYVEKLVIKLANTNPDPAVQTDSSTLIDGIYGTQFSMQKVPTLNPAYDSTFKNPVDPNNPTAAEKAKMYQYLDKDGNPVSKDDLLTALDNLTIYDKDKKELSAEEKKALIDQFTNDGTLRSDLYDKDGNLITEIGNVELVDDPNYRMQLDYLRDAQGELKPDNAAKNYKNEIVSLDDNDLYGSFQALREMLTEKGEFATEDEIKVDEKAGTKRGIQFYQRSLDALANKLASIFNEANKGYQIDENGGYYFKIPDGNGGFEKDENGKEKAETLTVTYYLDKDGNTYENPAGTIAINLKESEIPDGYQAVKASLKDEKDMLPQDKAAIEQYFASGETFHNYTTIEDVLGSLKTDGVELGGDLFTTRGDLSNADDEKDQLTGEPVPITAANISISFAWSKGTQRIVQSFIKPTGLETGTTDNTNLNHLLAQMTTKFEYTAGEVVPDAYQADKSYFKGTFHEMLSNTALILGDDQKSTGILLENYETSAVDLDSSRDGVSGVDLNDEAMNLMQYQKSYSAACRLMTAIDETLDRLINNTGLAGR